MKPKFSNLRSLAIASTVLVTVNSASAIDYYWNQNSTVAGWGAGGTWSTSSAVFTVAPENPTGTAVTATTGTGDTLFIGSATTGFAGGTLTLGATQSIGSIITGSANSTAGVVIDTQTLTFAAAGVITNNSSQGLIIGSVIGGAGTSLTLNAVGDITISAVTNTYGGITFVNSGTVTVNNGGALGTGGTDAARTVVASGARINFNNASKTYTERFVIAGAGVGGTTGALTNTQTGTILNGQITLSGAATIFNSSTLTIGGGILLGGNALTFNSGGTTTVSGTGISNGSVIKTGAGTLVFSATNTYTGGTTLTTGTLQLAKLVSQSATGAVAVGTGTTLAVNLGGTGEWTTATSGNGSIGGLLAGLGGQSGGTVNYTGAVALGFDTTNASPTTQTYAGNIGNVGTTLGITKLGTNTLTLSGINTYTGGTTLTTGTLQLAKLVSQSATGAVAVGTGTTLAVNLGGTGEWTTATSGNGSIGGLLAGLGGQAGGTVNYTGAVTLGFDTTNATSQTYTGNIGNVGTTLGLTKLGTNTLTLSSSSNTYTGATTVSNGRLSITGSHTNNTSSTYTIGNTANQNGVLNISTGAVVSLGSATAWSGTQFGTVSGSAGVLNISGGSYTSTNQGTAVDSNFHLGAVAGGYGYLNMTGGTVTLNGTASGTAGRLQLGTGNGAIGIARISAGTLTATEWLLLNRSGTSTGVFTVEGTGSVVHTVAAGSNGTQAFSVGFGGGRGEFNMQGGTFNNTGRTLNVGEGANATGIINFNGGTFTTNTITSNRAGNTVYINFNGGTLRAGAATQTLVPITNVTGIYVNSGGGMIDNNGFAAITIAGTLLAPTGNGIATLPVATGGTGYVGAPHVTISGTGVGATAIANMVDDGTGNGTFSVGSITITNPGVNYTGTPTFTFTSGAAPGTFTAATAGTVTTAANVSGGMTFTGTGTTTLSGTTLANTYTGLTTVNMGSGGVLELNKTAGTNAVGGNVTVSPATGGTSGAITSTLKWFASNQIPDTATLTLQTANSRAPGASLNTFSETIAALAITSTFTSTPISPFTTAGTLTVNGPLTFTLSGASNTANINVSTITLDLGAGVRDFSVTNSGGGTGITSISSTIQNGGINNTGTGTLALTGPNTYTGVTTLTAGILSVGSIGDGSVAGNLGQATNAATNIVFNGGTLQYTGASATSNRAFTINAGKTATIETTNDISFAGATGATTNGALTKTGIGKLTITGDNTYTGTTTISGGTLSIDDGSIAASSNIVNNAALIYNLNVNARTYANVISGSGTLTKSGTNTLTLSNANTYTGSTTIQSGTLIAGANALSSADGAFGNSSGAVFLGVASGSSDASILIGGAFTVGRSIRTPSADGSDTGTRVLTLGGSTADNSIFSGPIILGSGSSASRGIVLTAVDGGQVTFSGNIQNPPSQDAGEIAAALALTAVTKTGLGTVVLSGLSTYTGLTTINQGTLLIGRNAPSGSNGAFGNGTSNVSLGGASSASLLTNGAFTVGRNIDVASGAGTTIIGGNTADTSSFTGNIALSKAVTLQAFTGGTVDFATGTWSTGGFAVNVGTSGNTGMVKLNNDITTAGGINVNFGNLRLSSSTFTGNVTVASGATLSGVAGIVTGTTSVTSATVNGNTLLTLTGLTTFNGPGNVLSGTVTSTAGVTLAGSAAVTQTGTLTGNLNTTNTGTFTANGTVTGTASVANGGTLGGTGTINGSVSVASGGSLSPGASIQSLVTGALTMASTSTFVYEVADNSATGADLLGVNGALTLTGVNLDLTLANAALSGGGWTIGDKLTLISYIAGGSEITSGFTGRTDDTDYTFGSNIWRFDYNDTLAGGNFSSDDDAASPNRFVTFTVVPEPSSVALLGTFGAMLLLRRRR